MAAASRRSAGPRSTDMVYDEMRARILGGVWAPGEKLTESMLAEELGVSRTPVRAAIQRLAADGFVAATARSGTAVKSRTREEIADIYDVRMLIEAEAAALAARRASDEALGRLRATADAMEAIVGDDARLAPRTIDKETVEQLSHLNGDFHGQILRASGNATLSESGERLLEIGFLINAYRNYEAGEIAKSLADHRDLMDALNARDARWARAVMQAHIMRARRSLG